MAKLPKDYLDLLRKYDRGVQELVFTLRDVILEELETRARAARIGLWADPQPVPPWEWRQGRAGNHQRSWVTRLDTSLRGV